MPETCCWCGKSIPVAEKAYVVADGPACEQCYGELLDQELRSVRRSINFLSMLAVVAGFGGILFVVGAIVAGMSGSIKDAETFAAIRFGLVSIVVAIFAGAARSVLILLKRHSPEK